MAAAATAAAAVPTRNPLRRVRHIHIPDLPPAYAPLRIPRYLQALTEEHIRAKSALRAYEALRPETLPPWYTPTPHPAWSSRQIRFWAVRASPPPTVLTYTSQPAFAQVRDKDRRVAAKAPLGVEFPRPVGWRPRPWEQTRRRVDLLRGSFEQPEWSPFSEELRQVVNGETDVVAQPTYQGPGVLSILTSLDVTGERQDPSAVARKTLEFYQLVEKTTIAVLAYEYGLEGTRVRDQPGLWVSTQPPTQRRGYLAPRQIATIQHQDCDGAIRFRIAIHIGAPSVDLVRSSTRRADPSSSSSSNAAHHPWARLRPGHERTVTSVAAELKTSTAARCAALGGPSPSVRYLQTVVDSVPRDPVSLVHWKGKNKDADAGFDSTFTAPLGLDNYDVASAWALEFAAQLGVEYVDQLSCDSRFEECTVSARRDRPRLPQLPGVLAAQDDEQPRDVGRVSRHRRLPFSGWDVFSAGVEKVLQHANSVGEGAGKKHKDTRIMGYRERVPAAKEERQGLSCMALPAARSRAMGTDGI